MKIIDLYKVEELISEFEQKTGIKPNYLIMSCNTEKMIENSTDFKMCDADDKLKAYANSFQRFLFKGLSTSKELFGINIAICNALEDGEVEAVLEIQK